MFLAIELPYAPRPVLKSPMCYTFSYHSAGPRSTIGRAPDS